MNLRSSNLYRDYSNSFTMSNESELFLSRRIPENHIQVQKEKENLVFACLHSPINDGINTDVLDAMNSNVSLDETLLSHTVNLNAYFRLPFLTSGTSTLWLLTVSTIYR